MYRERCRFGDRLVERAREKKGGVGTQGKAALSGSGRGQPARGWYKSGGICGINPALERVIDSVEREGGKGSEGAIARSGAGERKGRTRAAVEGCARTPSL